MGVRDDTLNYAKMTVDPETIRRRIQKEESSQLDGLNRVESLARVCSLSKILATDLSDTVQELSITSPKQLKDDSRASLTWENSESVVPFYSSRERGTTGIYSRAERRAKLERYRAKKNRRTFSKKILYACRKSFADSRPRVGGRFVPLKDLPVSDAQRSPQQAEQEFSDLLASISADLAQQAKESLCHSPDLSHLPSLNENHSLRHTSAGFCSPTSSASATSLSFKPYDSSYSDFRVLSPYLQSPYYTPLSSPAATSPASFSYSFPSRPNSSSPLCPQAPNREPSQFYRSHQNSRVDEPASLLLLSLASSNATRAEVF